MRRLASSLMLAVVLGSGAVVVGLEANPVGAASPDQQGWWTTFNQGSAPELGKPISAPTPPDVPAKGLLVEGPSTSTSPLAYAALVYSLPLGATPDTLTLAIAAKSATTPKATLELCPLVNPVLNPEQGGAIADAPPYDCAHNVSATPNAAGSAYQFEVSQLATNGSLAVAILPKSPTDRVVFDQPDDHSLAVQPSLAGVPQTQSPSPGSTPASSSGIPLPEILPAFGSELGALPSPATAGGGPAPTGSAPAASPAPAKASPGSLSAIPTLGTLTGDTASPVTVALVIAGLVVGAGLWFGAGRRRPNEDEMAVID